MLLNNYLTKENIKIFVYFYTLNLLILLLFTNDFLLNFQKFIKYGDYYIYGYQGLCLESWKNKLLQTIFYSHSQAPLIPFFIGILLKFNLYPTGFFFINTIAATFTLIFQLKLLKLFIKEKIIFIFIFLILCLNPTNIWLQFILGWEIYLQLFILILIYSTYKIYKNNDNKIYYIGLSISFILLVLLRSTFSIHIFLLLSIPIFFISNTKLFFKNFFIPTFLVIFILLGKNYILHGSFTSQTQGILHLGFSHSPIVLEDDEIYSNWSNDTKIIYKNGLPPLWRMPKDHEKLGFVSENTGIDILDNATCGAAWSSKNMAEVSKSFGPIVKSQIFNEYDYLKNINFFRNTYNNFWGNVIEIQNLWDEGPKLNKFYYTVKNSALTIEQSYFNKIFKIEKFYIDIKSFFIILIIFLYLILGIKLLTTKNFKENMLLSLIITLISYTVFAAVVSKPANFRFRMVVDNLYLIFMFFVIYKSFFYGNKIFNNNFIMPKKIIIFPIFIFFYIACFSINQLVSNKILTHNEIHFSKYIETDTYKVELNNDYEITLNKKDYFEIKGKIFEPKSLNYILIRGGNKITQNIDDFHIQKYEVTLEDYMKFVEDTGRGHPIWFENEISVSDNLKNYRLNFIYDDQNLIPISGISYNDALNYSKWLSLQTGYEFDLPTNFEWQYAYEYLFENENGINVDRSLTNSLINRQPFNENLKELKIDVTQETLNKNSFNFIGSMWEYAKPDYNYLFTMEKYTYDFIDSKTYQDIKNEIYLYPVGNKRILKGGSYLTSWLTDHSGYRMFAGKTFKDMDFGFRLICKNCVFE